MSPLRLNGSTSGNVTLDCPAVGGNNTLVLPTGNGSNGQVLSTNGSGALSWVGAGKILQVVNATYSTEVSSSSSTFADTGLTTTIAPTSSSSKILVMVNQSGCFKQTGNTILLLRLLRGATNLFDFERQAGSTASTTTIGIGTAAICYLDSPATTSAVTYKTQLASSANIAEVRVQTASGGTSSTSTITLMEVAV